MQIRIENLGQISSIDMKINDLTIICGPNGSNKTWLSYGVYHYFNFPKLAQGIPRISKDKLSFNTYQSHYEIDMSEPLFFELLAEQFKIYYQQCANEINRTFNAPSGLFDHVNIQQLNDNQGASGTLEYIYAKQLQKYLIQEQLDTNRKGYQIQSKSNDELLKVLFREKRQLHDEQNSSVSKKLLDSKFMRQLSLFLADMIRRFPLPQRPFAISSERVGCLAFQKDIDGATLRIKDKIDGLIEAVDNSDSSHDNPLIRDMIFQLHMLSFSGRSHIAIPIRENLRAVREVEHELTKRSFLHHDHPEISEALMAITQGSFTAHNGQLHFQIDHHQAIPISVASSSIKSLFHLDLYINHLAKPQDILLIDEPELNLHPDNQRKMAKVIARLVNAGIKVLITSHSDYLLREINNSIMLSQEVTNKAAMMNDSDLIECDLLKPEQVSAYAINADGTCQSMAVDSYGINTDIFDDIISESNQLQNNIYYNLDVSDE